MKDVATDSTSYISIPASQSNNVTSPIIKNNQKLNNNNNNNNNSNSSNFNSKTGDFPVLTENKPAAEFFPAEPVDIFMKQPMFRKIAANVLQLVVVWGK